MDILLSTTTWLFISFFSFSYLVWRMGREAIANMLDSRIEKIKHDLQTSENLRIEAQELLAQYERKHSNALKESEEIIAQAEKRASEMREQAEQELDDLIKRRETQLSQRLSRMEQKTIDEITAYASDLTIEATKKIIAETLDKKAQNKLVGDAVNELSSHIH